MDSNSENKQAICNELLKALQLTRAGHEIVKLNYIEEKELVEIHYLNGFCQTVNVACDSGLAMILDVCKALI